MKRLLKIIALSLIFCMLFIGCSTNVMQNNTDDTNETELDSDQLAIITYQYDNFVQLVTNERYEIANNYWEDNVEFHNDKNALNYYYYNCGMISYNEGVFAHAIDYLEKVQPEILDVNQKLSEIKNEINKFNGIYKSETINETNICINNGYVDLIFDDDFTSPRYYTKVLKKQTLDNGESTYIISDDFADNNNYIIDCIENDCSSITISADKNNSQKIISGKFIKITDQAPPISNDN